MKWTLTLFAAATLFAQERILTLKQAVDLAARRNPDLVMAQLDEMRAEVGIHAAREPMLPRVTVGSGLAYTYGFPLSIEGSAPSIFEAAATRSIYNAPRNYQVAQARESAKGANLRTAMTREDVVLRTAVLFLDLERAARTLQLARRQLEHLKQVEAAVRLRVEAGRELPIEGRRAALNVLKGEARIQSAVATMESARRAVALATGLPPGEPIVPALEERPLPLLPENEEAAVGRALAESNELRKLESDEKAKLLESRGHRAARLPTLTFVAKYGLFARYNNFEDYFLRFQRNNAVAGMSFQVPLFASSSDVARAAQSELEANRLKTQANATRGRIESDARGAWSRVREADQNREVAKLDLDLARETVSVLLAQYDEGRASLRQVEEARFAENERWLGLWEAQAAAERARLELLRQTESLAAAFR
jgi:outer membrane protein TolC